VVAVHIDGRSLPVFSARPKSLSDSIKDMVIQTGIIMNHPTFNAKYCVRGSSDEAIRVCFNTKVCDFLVAQSDLCMEAAVDWLLIYSPYVLISPADIDSYLHLALHAAELFPTQSQCG
jgi:hypothetical protein